MSTKEQRAEIIRLSHQATPGPWMAEYQFGEGCRIISPGLGVPDLKDNGNAGYICAAVNNAADLAREVEELTEKLTAHIGAFDREHALSKKLDEANEELVELRALAVVLPVDRYQEGLDGIYPTPNGNLVHLYDVKEMCKLAGITIKEVSQ